MPRSATSDELALLASGNYNVWYQVWYENASGTLVDLTNLAGGIDALVGPIEIDRDIDQSIDALTIRVKRDLGPMPSLTAIDFRYLVGDNLSAATMTRASTASYLRDTAPTDRLSLSPLRTDSTLNRFDDGVTYGALVDIGRSILVKTAVVALGAAKPATGDAAWKTMFQGLTDTVTDDDASDATIEVKARDLGAVVADKWIGPASHDYTSLPAGGKPIQDVAQDVLDAAIQPSLGDPTVTLVTPVDPGYDIKTFSWSTESVIDVLTRLIQVIGADLRYRWDDATSAFQYQLTVPPRSKSTPDALIGPNQYMSVHQLVLDRTDVRNDITVYWGPAAADGSRASNDTGTGSDATSIARYGRRTAVDSEATDSPIDTLAEANRLAGLILSDVKDPKATQQIEMLYYWPVDLWDLHGYLPNGVHYDTQQNLSVVHIRHLLGANGGTQHRTLVDVRGTPAGSYLGWLTRMVGGTVLHAGDKPIASLTLADEDDTTVTLTLGGSAAPNLTNFLDYRVRQSIGGGAMPDWPDWVSGAVVSPDTFPTTTVNLAVTRLPIRTVRVELQVRQLDGQISDIVAYTVGAHIPSIDPGSGLPHRPVAFVEGGYAGHSTTSDGFTLHASVTDASSRPVDEMFHKLSDTADDIDDGGTHRVPLLAEADGGGWAHAGLNASGDVNRPVPLVHAVANVPAIKSTSGKLDPTIALDGTTGTPVHTQHAVAVLTDGADVTDGATRARGALDATTHELVTAVGAAATIAGLPSTVVGKKMGAFFVETWDALPSPATGWVLGGGSTLSVGADSSATMGPNLVVSTGYSQLAGPSLAFNPLKLYRMRVRVRTLAYNSGGAGLSLWYAGVVQANYSGGVTNANGGAAYIGAAGVDPGIGVWTEYVGWFRGATRVFSDTSAGPSADPANPTAINAGTVTIRPYLLMGYNGPGGTFECDYLLIDEFDEDGTMRTYKALDAGAVVVPTGLDFSRGYTNKHLDNIPDGSSFVRTTPAEKTGAGRAASTIDASGGVYVPDTTTVKVGTQATPSSLAKTIRLAAALFTPTKSTQGVTIAVSSGLVSQDGLAQGQPSFIAPIYLPRGATLTAVRVRLNAVVAESHAQQVQVNKCDDTGSVTNLALFNSTIATGWGTVSLALSETLASGWNYYVVIELANSGSGVANNVGFLWVEFDYDVPDYKTTV